MSSWDLLVRLQQQVQLHKANHKVALEKADFWLAEWKSSDRLYCNLRREHEALEAKFSTMKKEYNKLHDGVCDLYGSL